MFKAMPMPLKQQLRYERIFSVVKCGDTPFIFTFFVLLKVVFLDVPNFRLFFRHVVQNKIE